MADADVIVIGGGLAGLVAAWHAAERGRRVALLDMEGPQSLGGQAWWSLGGLFMVDTPEQRRLGLKDSRALAGQDWLGSARFDRTEDANPRAWAEAYLDFAAGPMRGYLQGLGMRWFPVVGWAERGGTLADGHGNSVPRFHITWGTGTGVVKPYADRVRAHPRITLHFRQRVTALIVEGGAVTGVSGEVLAPDEAPRGASTNRTLAGDFTLRAPSVVVASGGIGGNHDLVRAAWPEDRLGPPPARMVSGVPHYVDGQMQAAAEAAGAAVINRDRMWHYCEGLRNWDPIWPNHGIRILPGPSSMWFDAHGTRMESPCFPGFDTLATLKRILATGHGHSWFVLTQSIIEKEFALSGSEQNPDLTSGKWSSVLRERLGKGATAAVEAFKENGEDFVVADDLRSLVAGMNRITPDTPLDPTRILAQIEARDAQITNKVAKDAQVTAIRGARAYVGDRLIRTAKPHRILDPAHGPLIAVRLNVLTRKSLGGLHTDLTGRALRSDGTPFPGLYAAGEVAGFGGGGYHGYNALEGTFLGGCIFSGRVAGDAV
ncbi:FAD-binding dehydrogenase [Roseibacterium sp. SDUM158016]|uniref:FAD-binding dehydrogenase n=1 Tax=Roseicyclus sediminis TaxID=2980997 RepID=UPI0021D0810F|nr:FAD-binding dehydrogenase [Roseibacterium sp. SDUM158016]MCU4651245.1 FAD-binding dehydrogenase [Roseibacterium sp. SDUM158016]